MADGGLECETKAEPDVAKTSKVRAKRGGSGKHETLPMTICRAVWYPHLQSTLSRCKKLSATP